MIHKGVSRTFFLYAYNISDGTPKTGDASNITVYKAEDAGTATQITDTVTEIDATNMPGWYRLTTTLNGNSVAISSRSSTSGVAVTLGGVYLNTGSIPTAVAGTTSGLPIIGSAPLTILEVPTGSVQSDAGNTAKLFKTNLTGADSLYVGMFLVFTSGSNQNITREVIAFTGSTGVVEVNRPFPNTPSSGDTFRVLGYSGR